MSHREHDDREFYYSYGKVPSGRERDEREAETPVGEAQTPLRQEPYAGRPEVEMTAPVRTFPMAPAEIKRPNWSYSGEIRKPRSSSSFRSVFISFLAGALVVSGLMFASDRMNLFTDENSSAAGAGGGGSSTSSQAVAAAPGDTGSVKTAALDVVRPNTIAELVEIASPAVVKIQTYSTQRYGTGNSLFDQFFGVPRQRPGQGSGELVPSGSGSGFFFDKEGYILTNEHVINGAKKVEVIVEGTKDPYVAEVLGTAYDLDLAVLKIEGDKDFPTLPLGNSDSIRVGDWVVAIGNPYEFDHTVTVGVLSAKERSIDISDSEGTRRYQALLQTDASINPGNSGGPLLNLNGEVIGINTAVNAAAQGIGFAIPTSTIDDVLEALKANKTIPRPYIGVTIGNVPEQYVDDLKLEDADGAFVSEVVFGSPAHQAGLQLYDVIVAIDGVEIKTADEVTKTVGKKTPGDQITLDVIRNGQPVKVVVTVGDRNESARR